MFLFATCQKFKTFFFLAPILIKPHCNSLDVPFDHNKTYLDLHLVNLCLIFSIIWYSYIQSIFCCSATKRGRFLSMVFHCSLICGQFLQIIRQCCQLHHEIFKGRALSNTWSDAIDDNVCSTGRGTLQERGRGGPAGFIQRPDFAPAAPGSTCQGSGLIKGLLPRWFPLQMWTTLSLLHLSDTNSFSVLLFCSQLCFLPCQIVFAPFQIR